MLSIKSNFRDRIYIWFDIPSILRSNGYLFKLRLTTEELHEISPDRDPGLNLVSIFIKNRTGIPRSIDITLDFNHSIHLNNDLNNIPLDGYLNKGLQNIEQLIYEDVMKLRLLTKPKEIKAFHLLSNMFYSTSTKNILSRISNDIN